MNSSADHEPLGRVASLHMHPKTGGERMQDVLSIELVADAGIRGNERYFGRRSRSTGEPSKRQVSLIERERIAAHAQALGADSIGPGAVRANIETEGIDLVALIGSCVKIGEAILLLYEARKPCAKMDAVHHGLRACMENNRQGVLAQVRHSGHIATGDSIYLAAAPANLKTES